MNVLQLFVGFVSVFTFNSTVSFGTFVVTSDITHMYTNYSLVINKIQAAGKLCKFKLCPTVLLLDMWFTNFDLE